MRKKLCFSLENVRLKTSFLYFFFLFISWQANCQYLTETLAPTAVIKEGLSLEQSSDGRIFIAERAGIVKVFQNNAVSTVFTVTTVTDNEQGLLGLTLHPDFATNGYIYVFYAINDGAVIRHRIERVQIDNTNQVVARQEILLLEPIGGGFHNGGDLKFFNGFLYVTVGDSQQNTNSQDLDTYKGKILRLTENGLPAPGNPFFGSGSIQKQSIWVYGFRNPWRLVPNVKANKLFVLDVGTSWEEINEISNPTIRNYAWGHPQGGDGKQTETNLFTNPIFTYATGSIGNALTNGLLYNPTTPRYPNLEGKFIIKDFVRNAIRSFDPNIADPVSTEFYSAPQQMALGMMLGNDGYIYYCAYGNNGSLIRLNYIETAAPTIVNHPVSKTIMETYPVTFNVTASGVGLSYQWQFNNADIPGATASSYTIPNVTNANAGAYRVVVTNTAGNVTSNPATLTVTPFSNAPTVTLVSPLPTLKWNADDIINYAATATDIEDGVLPASAFSWSMDLFHEDIPGAGHSHPGASPQGVSSGTFLASNQGEKTPNVWYRFTVKVTDSNGLTASTYVDVYPNLVDVTTTSSPVLLNLEFNQKPIVAPATKKVVANANLQTLNAPTPQYVGNIRYDFDHWSQGGTVNQNFKAPATGTITYTAFYTATTLGNAPYLGTIAQIPGTIEAENYDVGPTAFLDTNGGGDTPYRTGDGVGTEACSEGGFNIAYVAKNEWLKYTAKANTTGNYDIKLRISTPYENRKVHLEVDGVNVTGVITIPNTTGFQNWQTVNIPNIPLTQSVHTITLFFDEADININKLEFSLSGNATTPVADFEVSSSMGCLNTPVSFTSVSIGTIDTYNWSFGEGAQPATATGIGPHSVVYGTEGDKTVSLTVTNTAGNNKKEITYMVHNCNLGIEIPTEESKKIVVYPNPSKGIFYLSKELEWSVYAASGAKIKQGSGTVINISEQANGIYLIKNNESSKAISIMKQ
ncbi:PKD domain-containing protein [Flavobacterium circumlabens]|uniref:PKD domain-containing protein n=1 Tax=Flavobacterium circumlabens TaxID=2133765 RepID=A0A4Y7U8S7_9FLAO|nr:PQQ-dependent sugar dehydrogenase [Flavobacterium circumlabens]TCN54641.1 putative secreted protein (Por secretion system target) [Flavobacterium circumlabens]TEB42835.1 PKD domain-containing protein [Flavobacterium circumlabens]